MTTFIGNKHTAKLRLKRLTGNTNAQRITDTLVQHTMKDRFHRVRLAEIVALLYASQDPNWMEQLSFD